MVVVRSRRSAKAAGTRFTSMMAGYFARVLGDDRIERRALCGAKDRGDIAGIRLHGERVVVECKDCARMELPKWLGEAEIERGNDDAGIGIVCHKRKGSAKPEEQYVTMTARTFAQMVAGGSGLIEEE